MTRHTPPICPECRDGKCRNCDNRALDEHDQIVECHCPDPLHHQPEYFHSTQPERHCRRLAVHNPHEYVKRGTIEIYQCPGIAHDHEARCCTEHGTHTTPHKGCVLR